MPKKASAAVSAINSYAGDFRKFAAAMKFPAPGAKQSATDDGMRPFGNLLAPHQLAMVEALAPSLLAVAKGEAPPARGVWMEATKGAAKDTILALACLWLCAFSRRPLTVQVGAADRDQADEMHKAARMWLHWNPWLAERVKVTNYVLACEATGVEVEIIPSDVAGSHGARPDLLIVNEISHVQKWEFILNLLDNASKVPTGLTIIATNAGFRGSEAWRLREMARRSGRWIFLQYDRPAPWLSEDDLEEARVRNSASRFARLWSGVWVNGTGDALDATDIEACTRKDLGAHTKRLPGWQYVCGVDLAVRRDHAALVTLGRPPKSSVPVLVNCRSWQAITTATGTKDIDLTAVEQAILNEHRTFRPNSVRFDPHQAQLMAQRLRKMGVQMMEVPFVGKQLNEMASCLLQTFRERSVVLYDDHRLIRDLLRLVIVEKSYGVRLESVRDAEGHADTATAFAIALPGIKALTAKTAFGWDGTVTVSPATSMPRTIHRPISEFEFMFRR